MYSFVPNKANQMCTGVWVAGLRAGAGRRELNAQNASAKETELTWVQKFKIMSTEEKHGLNVSPALAFLCS